MGIPTGKGCSSSKSEAVMCVKDFSTDEIDGQGRKENYLIGMLNKGVLAFPVSTWISGVCLTSKIGPNAVQNHLVLPKTLEQILNWCILESMFDRNFRVRRDLVSDSRSLRRGS